MASNRKDIIANLPCGSGGLNSNFNTFRVPINQLVRATNVRFDNLCINKSPGIEQLGADITGTPTCLGAINFDITAASAAGITAWSDGNIYKESSNDFDNVNLGAFGATAEPVVMVPYSNLAEAGTPVSNRLMFFSTGTTPKHLIGSAATFTTLTAVSADWAGANAPSGGTLHDFRMVGFGVTDYPHNLYFSTLSDLSDFTGAGSRVTSVFPGEGGSRIVAAASYLETLLAVFKDNGIYVADTTDLTQEPPVYRITNKIGCAGPNAITKVDGDLWFVSDQGHIHILSQIREDIDPRQSDLTHLLQLTEFTKRTIDLTRLKWARLHFDTFRREVIFSYTSISGTTLNDQCIIIKLATEQSPPMVSIDDRGEFYNAIWARKNASGEHEVLCAGGLGKVCLFNSLDYSILGEPYTAIYSHPPTDFSYLEPKLSTVEKAFKFLNLQILPSGMASTLHFDIIVDGTYRRSESVSLVSSTSSLYGSALFGTGTYAGSDFEPKQVPLDVTGTKLQILCYNSEVDENFSIVDMNVVFEVADSRYEDV